MARQPEPGVAIYDLGHYEQMQIDLAIASLLDAMQPEGRLFDLANAGSLLDVRTLLDLRQIFAAHATVTIIRRNITE